VAGGAGAGAAAGAAGRQRLSWRGRRPRCLLPSGAAGLQPLLACQVRSHLCHESCVCHTRCEDPLKCKMTSSLASRWSSPALVQ